MKPERLFSHLRMIGVLWNLGWSFLTAKVYCSERNYGDFPARRKDVITIGTCGPNQVTHQHPFKHQIMDYQATASGLPQMRNLDKFPNKSHKTNHFLNLHE